MSTTTLTEERLEHGADTPESSASTLQPIEAEVAYLIHDQRHQYEKPFRLNYDPEGKMPRSNTKNELKPALVHNFRHVQNSKSFEEFGFTSTKLSSALQPVEFDDANKVERVYYLEATKMLEAMFPEAAKVEILEHQIRKRHPAFPVATGEPYENLLPATLVHVDFTAESAIRTSRAAFRDSSDKYSRLMTVNVWKSLQGPGNDWPLALCDRRTVDHTSELIGQDNVFHDRFNENARVYYSPKHQWYYFENLGRDEAIVFLQTDSELEGGGGVPHTGFQNPRTAKGAAPRVSVEIRAFLYFV